MDCAKILDEMKIKQLESFIFKMSYFFGDVREVQAIYGLIKDKHSNSIFKIGRTFRIVSSFDIYF